MTRRSRGSHRPGAGRWLAAALALLALRAGPAAGQDEPAAARGLPAVDSLVSAGRLQEAAWLARERGDTARAVGILERLDSLLRSAPREVRPLGIDSQGVSYTFYLTHGQGVASIFKVDGSDIFCRECGADREIASYRVDRLLGFDLAPMTVPLQITADSDTLDGSAMYYMADTRQPREVGAEKPDALRLFDAIIGNSDRHRGNWLVTAAGRAVAIDHNRAFEYRPGTRPKTCWETEVDSIARPAELGVPFARYRTLPAESLAAAVDVLPPELADLFVAMRDSVVARVEQRIRHPEQVPPHRDCQPES